MENTEKNDIEKSVKASFYRAYCENHKKALCNWTNDETVAKNAKEYHLRSNSGHYVRIEWK